MSLFKFGAADENGRSSNRERMGDCGRREPWVPRRIQEPTLPANNVASVATKNRVFTRAHTASAGPA